MLFYDDLRQGNFEGFYMYSGILILTVPHSGYAVRSASEVGDEHRVLSAISHTVSYLHKP
jgi:hypothetical protein